ncbi:MAG: MGMT family protein [Planctomycetota bacterium]
MASTFTDRCYALCRTIPRGRVTTYGEMAKALGSPGAARAVGNAMRTNPDAPRTPCHRVVGGDGRLTGYAFGLERKAALLEQEGVPVRGGRADLSKLFRFEKTSTTNA